MAKDGDAINVEVSNIRSFIFLLFKMSLSHYSWSIDFKPWQREEIFWKKEDKEETIERDSFTIEELAEWFRTIATLWKEENILQPN